MSECDKGCYKLPKNSGDESICRHGKYYVDFQQADFKLPIYHKFVDGKGIKSTFRYYFSRELK